MGSGEGITWKMAVGTALSLMDDEPRIVPRMTVVRLMCRFGKPNKT